jgi:hypothetical protein
VAVAVVGALRLVDRGRRIAPASSTPGLGGREKVMFDRIRHQGQTAANPPGNGCDTLRQVADGKGEGVLSPRAPEPPINRRLA